MEVAGLEVRGDEDDTLICCSALHGEARTTLVLGRTMCSHDCLWILVLASERER